jgi:nitroreductase
MTSKFRKSIPTPVKHAILVGIIATEGVLVRVFSANRYSAALYYFLFSRTFDREHLAVLKGRAAYFRALRQIDDTSPLLRRNVHRLEKGLIMQPRRPVFAEAFILETVRCYKRARSKQDFSQCELKWANDVLDAYFQVVDDTAVIVKARREYKSVHFDIAADRAGQIQSFKPYPLSECPKTDISFEQLSVLFLRRRSVRWYEQKVVPLELIQKSINAAALAPSACNRQPFRFLVANDPDRATEIAECAGGTKGFAKQLPAILVVVGDLSAYPKERDRHLIYIDASLASMQLMLAASTLGLSTCPINWPDVASTEEKLQRILKLPGHERVVMLISIGFGRLDSGIPYSQKKQNSMIIQGFSET